MKHNLHSMIQVVLGSLLFAVPSGTVAQEARTPVEREPEIILGVLEDQPGMYVGEANVWRVRVLFKKEGSEWKPFPNRCADVRCLEALPKEYPKEVNWTIAFDGRVLGRVTGRTLTKFPSYYSVGCEEITSSGAIPTVGRRSEENSGWLSSPVFRPLVAVSKPYFKDPEGWKPAHPSAEVVTSLRQKFRGKFPNVSNCRNPDENQLRPWPYQDKDIMVGKNYSSKKNWQIAELHLREWKCDGPQEDDSAFLTQWYAITASGESRYLGSGMRLVDAGDYDGDGKSEVLFAVGGYNRDGYRLFYQKFTRTAEFLFSYH